MGLGRGRTWLGVGLGRGTAGMGRMGRMREPKVIVTQATPLFKSTRLINECQAGKIKGW